jgi:hypothetical protein
MAALIALRRLDLDHLCPKICEEHSTIQPYEEPGQVQNAHP